MAEPDNEWIQLSLQSGTFSTDEIEDALLTLGALAVTLENASDQPILEPLPGTTPLWRTTRVTGLFDAATDVSLLRRHLAALLGEDILAACRLENLEDRDWVRAWLDDFKPLRFGKRLWIIPSGYQAPDDTAVNLLLDPGLAFGTGTHPTTALCLEWLDGAELSGKTVLDYGCGSGILAIAAARLGAEQVYAVDIDPQAILACEQNAERNQVEISTSDVAGWNSLKIDRVDVVVANILAGPLAELAPTFAALLSFQGELIMSGLLHTQVEQLSEAYRPWFDLLPSQRQGSWCLLHVVRNNTLVLEDAPNHH